MRENETPSRNVLSKMGLHAFVVVGMIVACVRIHKEHTTLKNNNNNNNTHRYVQRERIQTIGNREYTCSEKECPQANTKASLE
jgi:hypothetical protein